MSDDPYYNETEEELYETKPSPPTKGDIFREEFHLGEGWSFKKIGVIVALLLIGVVVLFMRGWEVPGFEKFGESQKVDKVDKPKSKK